MRCRFKTNVSIQSVVRACLTITLFKNVSSVSVSVSELPHICATIISAGTKAVQLETSQETQFPLPLLGWCTVSQ